MKIKHIIWDWNGTLLNDNWLAITAINILLKRYDLPSLSLKRYLRIFSFPVIDYYERLGFDFNKTPFKVVGTEFIDEYTKRMYQATLQDGASDSLEYFNNIGIGQSLLSAAKQKMLDDLMEYHNLNEYFYKVCGLSDHYANSKVEAGKELIAELDCKPNEAIMVGDTIHDAEVADEIGTQCILIAQGHAPYEKLLSSGKIVFNNLNDFIEWFKKQ